jgi:hypothetical protein
MFRLDTLTVAEDTVEATLKEKWGSGAIFKIEGTWVGTITWECRTDNLSTWVSIMATNATTNAMATTAVSTGTDANGVYRIVADGLRVRARMSAYTSGTANVDAGALRA